MSVFPAVLPAGGGVVSVQYSVPANGTLRLNGASVRVAAGSGTVRLLVPATGRVEFVPTGTAAGTGDASVTVAAPPAAPRHRWLGGASPAGVELRDLNASLAVARSWPLAGPVAGVRGLAFDPVHGRLFVAYWDVFRSGTGQVAAFDLTGRALWQRALQPSVDSLAVTPDGNRLLMPCGEEWTTCDSWSFLDAATGLPTGDAPVHVHSGAHNTVVAPDGRTAYLAALGWNNLAVVDLTTGQQRLVGPLAGNVRPFAVNAAGTLAVINEDRLSGFQVADLTTGKVLYTVSPPGFPVTTWPALPETQSHGVAFSPDEREIWVSDAQYKAIHVFDATGLPGRAPTLLATIQLAQPPKWINFSLDGRLAFISTGDVLDARDRTLVGRFTATREFLEVDETAGGGFETNTRYGNGRRDPARPGTPAAPGAVALKGDTLSWGATAGAAGFNLWRGPAGQPHTLAAT
ncbi:MAG TPA: hypothetical protein VHN99_05795, partial [Deinococcales bacterium]|nr:hypothetical protein [Deinococcales bacterium]